MILFNTDWNSYFSIKPQGYITFVFALIHLKLRRKTKLLAAARQKCFVLLSKCLGLLCFVRWWIPPSRWHVRQDCGRLRHVHPILLACTLQKYLLTLLLCLAVHLYPRFAAATSSACWARSIVVGFSYGNFIQSIVPRGFPTSAKHSAEGCAKFLVENRINKRV